MAEAGQKVTGKRDFFIGLTDWIDAYQPVMAYTPQLGDGAIQGLDWAFLAFKYPHPHGEA